MQKAVKDLDEGASRPDHRWIRRTDPEIGDYAIIGDCRTAALISRAGSMDWLCLPHFSGASVFGALLDQVRGGRFGIQPGEPYVSSRRYISAAPVLETTFRTASGTARLTDLMPVMGSTGDLRPMREVLRIVEGLEGEVALDIHFEPGPDYARAKPLLRSRGALGWACTWRDELLLLHGDARFEIASDSAALVGRIRLKAGEKMALSLVYAKGDVGVIAPLGQHAQERLEATLSWWDSWAGRCTYRGPYRDAVLRSAVTLKLMTFALSGAVVAAPTTSLPEAIGADRNWDYRYCWLRDAALTMRAFTGLGYHEEARAFLHWLLHATRLTWPKLQVMYDVYGRTNLREEELTHLSGYRGSRPVRIGNEAHAQIQLDVYGEVIAAAYQFAQSGGRLERDEAQLLAGLGETVCYSWREPDHGIWEIRGPKRHHTFSKVMCWIALDSLVALHRRGAIRIDVDRVRRERHKIAEVIETRGYNEELRSYVSELDGDRVDAALLQIGCLGYQHPAHSRMRSTFERISERLERNGLIYRYEHGSDGFDAPENAFGLCCFWAIANLAARGDIAAARERFEHVLSFASDLGLFSEEIDVETGAAIGNFPQAFTHVGLVNAAMALAEAETGSGR